jgi:anti-sigma regulatory factor (Ser/Thr protein kinase)
MSSKEHILTYQVPGDDFTRAGEASSSLKNTLRMLGVDNAAIRKVSIAMYEGEINMVIHANGGEIQAIITDKDILITITDTGPGIPDIPRAMEEGFSTAPDEVRSLGFGAGMGLPNMRRSVDEFELTSEVGVGTKVVMRVYF